jgi:hypothetical protein
MIEQKHLNYLDNLRKSSITNMFGARHYLMNYYPELTKEEAGEIMKYWMDNFNPEGTKLTT